jgi:hypothetical protein
MRHQVRLAELGMDHSERDSEAELVAMRRQIRMADLLPDEPDALRVPVRERKTILCTSLE